VSTGGFSHRPAPARTTCPRCSSPVAGSRLGGLLSPGLLVPLSSSTNAREPGPLLRRLRVPRVRQRRLGRDLCSGFVETNATLLFTDVVIGWCPGKPGFWPCRTRQNSRVTPCVAVDQMGSCNATEGQRTEAEPRARRPSTARCPSCLVQDTCLWLRLRAKHGLRSHPGRLSCPPSAPPPTASRWH
jgi:hypothetical protein